MTAQCIAYNGSDEPQGRMPRLSIKLQFIHPILLSALKIWMIILHFNWGRQTYRRIILEYPGKKSIFFWFYLELKPLNGAKEMGFETGEVSSISRSQCQNRKVCFWSSLNFKFLHEWWDILKKMTWRAISVDVEQGEVG